MNIYNYFEKPTDFDGYHTILLKPPQFVYEYAETTNKPFPEGEKTIASNSTYAYNYAIHVVKERFRKGEKAINSNPTCKKQYKEFLNSL